MTEQRPAFVAPGNRHLGLWFAGAVVVVAVVVAVVFGSGAQPPPVVDDALAAGLLDSADFAPGFRVSAVTQDEVDRLPARHALPETINPPGCSELLRTGPGPAANQRIAAVEAADADGLVVYLHLITPVDQVPGWDPARGAAMVSECGEVTFAQGNRTSTLYVSEVAGVEGDGYATFATTGADYGLGGFDIASAAVAVGPNLVRFIGVGPKLDKAEFVRLANAAVDRARVLL